MAISKSNLPEREHLEQDVHDACEKSPEGADLLISAFVGALRSYRRASVCAPFPGFLTSNVTNKDFKSATEFVAHIPSTQEIASSGYGGPERALNPVQNIPLQALMLLHWILRFRYHVQLVQDLDEISGLGLPDALRGSSKLDMTTNKCIPPSHILKIRDVDEHRSVSGAFQTAKLQHGSIMAFHGTTAESLHSILRCGLLNMSNTRLQRNGAMFGNGVYLSTDLGVAFSFCKSGDTWERSCFGARVRYVLLCEVAKGEGVTCSTSDVQGSERAIIDRRTEDLVQKSATQTHGTYVVVANSDLIRIRFVLVFREYTRDLTHRDTEMSHSVNQGSSWKGTFVQKVCSLDWVILLYVCLLLIVGFSNSGLKLRKLIIKVMKQLSWVVDRWRVWIDHWINTPHL